MTHQEILTKAIEKAIAGGWREDEFRTDKRYKWPPKDINLEEDRDYYANSGWWISDKEHPQFSFQVCQSDDYEDLIYSHNFAKALWGDIWPEAGAIPTGFEVVPRWKIKLQEMVIAPDPIKYLGDNI